MEMLKWFVANSPVISALLIVAGLAIWALVAAPRKNAKSYRYMKGYGSISPVQTIMVLLLVLVIGGVYVFMFAK